DRPAQLAGPHAEQRVTLGRRRAVVHVDADLPVAFQDVAGNVRQNHQRPAGDVDAVRHSLVDVPREHAVAPPTVRILADPAGTERVARTDLQEPALELVRHRMPPLTGFLACFRVDWTRTISPWSWRGRLSRRWNVRGGATRRGPGGRGR